MQSRRAAYILGACLIAVLAVGLWWFEQQRVLTVTVTSGTALVLPANVRLIVGLRDTLIIRNETEEQILLVGRPIAPHQQIRQRYRTAGVYQYVCTSHGGASMDVIVEPYDIKTWLLR